jgi:hypothetical protein
MKSVEASGETEISQLDMPTPVKQNIIRLYVTKIWLARITL